MSDLKNNEEQKGKIPTPPANHCNGIDLPLDTLKSLTALFDARVCQTPNQPFLHVPESIHPFKFATYTFSQVDCLVRQATAHFYPNLPSRKVGELPKMVGILSGDPLEFAINQLAILRLGHSLLFLSANTSVNFITHLFKQTGAGFLVCSLEKKDQAQQAIHELQSLSNNVQSDSAIQLFNCFRPRDFQPQLNIKGHRCEIPHQEDDEKVFLIFHSSGSTATPKPIHCLNTFLLQPTNAQLASESFVAIPIYHAFGNVRFWQSIIFGKRLYIYKGPLVAETILEAIQASRSSLFFCVPWILKLLSETELGIEALQRFNIVAFAGSPCPVDLGNMLVQRKVPLVGIFGATEYGAAMTSLRDFETDNEWNVARLISRILPYVHFENVGTDQNGPFELVISAGWKGLNRRNRPDGSYATNDLFLPHPTIQHGWVFVGRADDTIIHTNGLKTDPLPIEAILRTSPFVWDCMVVGAGRQQPGILIIPSKQALERMDESRQDQIDQALTDKLLPFVEEANAKSPSHSRIVPELIKILPADATFPTFVKLVADAPQQPVRGVCVRRQAVVQFQEEIETLYANYYSGTLSLDHHLSASKVVLKSEMQAQQLVQTAVQEVLGKQLTQHQDADFLHLGLDSLTATRVRTVLLQRVELSKNLSNNVVFENPSVNKLTHHLWMVSQQPDDVDKEENRKRYEIDRVLQIYETLRNKIKPRVEIVDRHGQGPTHQRQVVVLTGSAGSLGAHIFHQLCLLPNVARIICLNRAIDNGEAKHRTQVSLEERQLPSLEELSRTRANDLQLDFYASNLELEDLGLAQPVYADLIASTTTVIHNAWPVNFNMSVDSFYPSLLATVHLINLACQSRASNHPRFCFSSSVSAAMARPGTAMIPETISEDPQDALPNGYARSKWIAELLCREAAMESGKNLSTTVMRIGQLVGDRQNGIWKEKEALPMLLKSAQTLGCLPLLNRKLSWLPVNDAAWMVVQLAINMPTPDNNHLPNQADLSLVHVVNDQLTSFDSILGSLAQPNNLSNNFDQVTPSEWIDRLKQSDQGPDSNPTILLLDHYQKQFQNDSYNDLGDQRFQIHGLRQKLQHVVTELEKRLRPVDTELVSKFVHAWRTSGFLSE